MRISSELPPDNVPFILLPDVMVDWTTEERFRDWWGARVIVTSEGEVFTRKDIVYLVANEDGGAHVSLAQRRKYARLARYVGLGFQATYKGEPYPLPNPALAAMRQIAWEVGETLKNVVGD